MFHFLLTVIWFVMFGTLAIAGDNAKAIALLKGVEQERLKYDCFHIRYEEHRAEEGKFAEQIVNFDKGRIHKEHIPNGSFAGMKSIVLEDIVYYMMTYSGAHVAIVPHQSVHARGANVYDPRVIGLTDTPSHTRDVRTCLLYKDRNDFSVSHENLGDRSVFIVECHDGEDNGFAHWKFYIEEPGFHLIKQTVEGQFGKIQIESDYSEKRLLPFPTKTHIYRVETNGEIVADRHITIKDVQIKKSFPPETFTLAALKPPLNSDVVDYRSNRRLGYWDGEKLVDRAVRMSAQEFRELMEPKKHGWINYLFMGIGGMMILYAFLRIFVKRRRKVE